MKLIGTKISGGQKFSNDAGGGADFTDDIEAGSWPTGAGWTMVRSVDITQSAVARFVQNTDWASTDSGGSNGVRMDRDSSDPDVAYRNYGSEPARFRIRFNNDTTGGSIILIYGNWIDGGNDMRGGMVQIDMGNGNLYISHFDSSGHIITGDDTQAVTLSNSTEYILQCEISTTGSTTTLSGKVFNTSEVQQGNTVSHGFTNDTPSEEWTNNIGFGCESGPEYADLFEVYDS